MEMEAVHPRLKAFLRGVRYVAVGLSLATVTVVIGHTVPGLRRSIRDLRLVETRDRHALSLANELESTLARDSDLYVEMVRSAQARGIVSEDNRQLEAYRHRVGVLAGQLLESGAAAAEVRRFVDEWRRALPLSRKGIEIAAAQRAPSEALWPLIRAAGGPSAFATCQQTARQIKESINQSSSETLHHASASLVAAVVQMIVLLGVIFLCTVLLTWLEWRHRRTLRQLEQANRQIRESEQRFQSAYEEASVGIAVMDLDGRFVALNRAMAEVLGYERAELVGMSATQLLAPEERDEAARMLGALTAGMQAAYRVERRGVRKDGRYIWVRNSVSLLHAQGKPARVFMISEDVTERRAAFDVIEHQAMHDRVTSLVNRFGFERALRRRMELHGAAGAPTGLLYLDLDEFKLVNDTLGHALGDQVLTEVGQRISACRRSPGDLVARLGGDEFALIVNDCGDKQELADLATTVLRALDAPFHFGPKELYVGVTIGIASCPEDGADPTILLQSADSAMYEAKRAGKHRFSFFTESMRQQALDRRRIESCLRAALQRKEFSVCYQPLYELDRGNLVRFEALCRWRSPELGEVPPARFIPVAEECGLISELGEFVLREACREARRWSEAGSSAGVSVNVSAIQFASPSFVDLIREVLESTGLAPERLDLELTESVLLRNIEQAVIKIDELREMGVRVSVDDFGTGYSSLSYLQKMPVHSVKIDRSFVTDIDSNSRSVSMVRSVIAMAHAVGLMVVTEGVETCSQLSVLKDLGCDEVQGFLLGEPVPGCSVLSDTIPDGSSQSDIVRLAQSPVFHPQPEAFRN
ncbi:MAG TPA: EAL domain-containing protein [Bryobacteraceae bacterium]|nr:EAL domain-containing protein [Bryobacteraceae bacterium]